MKIQGDNFKFYFNNESKTKEEIEQLIDYDTTVSIKGFDVHYFSPKKDKIQKLLEEVNKHQKQNGGILKGVEFPFDAVSNSTRNKFPKYEEGTVCNNFDNDELNHILFSKEQKVIEDWNKKEAEQKEEGIGLNIMPNGMPRGKIFTYQPIERKVRINFYSYDKKNNPIIEVKEFDCLLKAVAYFRESKHTEAFIYKYGTHDLINTWNKGVPTTKKSESIKTEKNGIKETENKVNYEELDWDYIDSMAERMSKNLAKYPPKNWQKNMNIKELAKSAIRHARKILQEIDGDEETLQEHSTALGCNGMMINYQLKNK